MGSFLDIDAPGMFKRQGLGQDEYSLPWSVEKFDLNNQDYEKQHKSPLN